MSDQGKVTVSHKRKNKQANLLTYISKNLPDGYIYGYIRNGGVWMPAYNDAMSSTERWQVVLYVRDLERKLGSETASAPSTAPTEAATEHRSATDSDESYTETGSDSP